MYGIVMFVIGNVCLSLNKFPLEWAQDGEMGAPELKFFIIDFLGGSE